MVPTAVLQAGQLPDSHPVPGAAFRCGVLTLDQSRDDGFKLIARHQLICVKKLLPSWGIRLALALLLRKFVGKGSGRWQGRERMIFLTYDFVWFALAFFLLYALTGRWPALRLAIIIVSGIWFQFFYGGLASIVVTLALAAISYAAGRSARKSMMVAAIAICIATLLYSKYTVFLVQSAVEPFSTSTAAALSSFAPAAIPLGISFFTFEFVHYLVDVHRGYPPIKRIRDFVAFAMFWPTMVAGPIKRYQQFIPALHTGLASLSASDAMIGLIRIAMGLCCISPLMKCTSRERRPSLATMIGAFASWPSSMRLTTAAGDR